jgi:hypothetical protein
MVVWSPRIGGFTGVYVSFTLYLLCVLCFTCLLSVLSGCEDVGWVSIGCVVSRVAPCGIFGGFIAGYSVERGIMGYRL